MLLQVFPQVFRNDACAVDHVHLEIVEAADLVPDNGIVGTAEYQCIDIAEIMPGEVRSDNRIGDIVEDESLFDHRNEQGCGEGADPQGGVFFHYSIAVAVRFDGGAGADHPYLLQIGGTGHIINHRIDHIQHNGPVAHVLFYLPISIGRGGVTGDQDDLTTLFQQEIGDAGGVSDDGLLRFVAIWQVGGVAVVEQLLSGENGADRMCDRESAHT